MSKAFDEIWHEGLIYKLHSYGVQSKLLDLVNDYLDNRGQRVIINVIPSWKPNKSGVPQYLVPLVFINDLPNHLICNPTLFEEDVSKCYI